MSFDFFFMENHHRIFVFSDQWKKTFLSSPFLIFECGFSLKMGDRCYDLAFDVYRHAFDDDNEYIKNH